MLKVIDGHTYTAGTDNNYHDENGGEWVAFEAKDMRSKIRWAGQEMAKAASRGLENYDNAAAYTEALEIQAQTEEDLRIVELLFGK